MERVSGTSAEDDDPGDGWGGQLLRRANCPNCSAVSRTILMLSCTCFLIIFVVLSHNELLKFFISIYALNSIFTSELHCQKCKKSRRSDAVVQPPERDKFFDIEGLPPEVKGRVLEHLDYEQVIQLKSLSRSWKNFIHSDGNFLQALSLRDQPMLTACYFFIQNGIWEWAGFDPNWRPGLTTSSKTESTSNATSNAGKWRRLPSLTFFPANCDPDPDLFKQFLFCAKDGLVCMNCSKSAHEERLIVFNPLSGHWKELPPLPHRRNPVLLQMLADPSSKAAYQVLAAGSSNSQSGDVDDEHLSKITELYDSQTGRWERVGNVPGPAFALNQYQSGVYHNGHVYCIGFLELHDSVPVKGILGYNVEHRRWTSTEWTDQPLPNSSILQLVETKGGELYLFSERENGRVTEHWIDRVEWTRNEEQTTWKLINVFRKERIGGRSLESYPESVLVPFGKWQLCVYNTIDHTGEVFDVQDQEALQSVKALPALPGKGFQGELGFFTLNPLSFAIEPRFNRKV